MSPTRVDSTERRFLQHSRGGLLAGAAAPASTSCASPGTNEATLHQHHDFRSPLMIDEMSLGQAPVILRQMFPIVRDAAAPGMAVLLVEQHVKNALEVADFGTIIDGGVTRLSGSAAELRESDVVRESYLGH